MTKDLISSQIVQMQGEYQSLKQDDDSGGSEAICEEEDDSHNASTPSQNTRHANLSRVMLETADNMQLEGDLFEPCQSDPGELQFTEASSQKTRVTERLGTGIMMAGGYSYRRERPLKRKLGYTSYRCVDKTCPGRVHIEDATLKGKMVVDHGHSPDFEKMQIRLIRDNLEKVGRDTALDTDNRQSIDKVLKTLSDEALASVASPEAFKRSVQRTRKRFREEVGTSGTSESVVPEGFTRAGSLESTSAGSVRKEVEAKKYDATKRRRSQRGTKEDGGDKKLREWKFWNEMFPVENDEDMNRPSCSLNGDFSACAAEQDESLDRPTSSAQSSYSTDDSSQEPPVKKLLQKLSFPPETGSSKSRISRGIKPEIDDIGVQLVADAVKRLSEGISERRTKSHSRAFAEALAASLEKVEEKNKAAALMMRKELMDTCFKYESENL